MTEVEVFTGPGCSQCEAAKRLLIDHDVSFVERRVDDGDVLDEFRQRLPRVTALPQIFVDGAHIGSTEDLLLAHQRGHTPFTT